MPIRSYSTNALRASWVQERTCYLFIRFVCPWGVELCEDGHNGFGFWKAATCVCVCVCEGVRANGICRRKTPHLPRELNSPHNIQIQFMYLCSTCSADWCAVCFCNGVNRNAYIHIDIIQFEPISYVQFAAFDWSSHAVPEKKLLEYSAVDHLQKYVAKCEMARKSYARTLLVYILRSRAA